MYVFSTLTTYADVRLFKALNANTFTFSVFCNAWGASAGLLCQ